MPALIFLFGFFLYIYCEISLLVSVGSSIGVLPLILLMIAISASGMWLVKLGGVRTLLQAREQFQQGTVPTQAVLSSIFFAIAGFFLLIPGFLSDILAISLLLPATQRGLYWLFKRYFAKHIRFQHHRGFHRQDDNVFEAEFERQQDEDKRLK